MDEALVLKAKDYEAALNRNFVPSAEDLKLMRTEGFDYYLTYDAAEDSFTVKYPGGFGGALSKRVYLGYVATNTGFDVYYGEANYCFLADVLPEGMTEQAYAENLGNPMVLEYEGKQYENSPDGYYYLGSVERSGMKYSLVSDNDNLRISGAAVFTEEECPESFEKLPPMDNDLLSILSNAADLIAKYGPEISDEVKNGTTKGTTGQYKPGKNSYYVAIGDDTAADKNSYVQKLADGLKISYKNLAAPGLMIEDVNAAFLDKNAEEIKKADLITIGFSINGFAAVAVEESLKNTEADKSYMQWGRYLSEEGVQEVESVLARLKKYLVDKGMTGSIMGISKSDALVVAAESMAFGTLAFSNELPRIIDEIQAINSNAQIIVVGMDNPMENSTITLSNEEKIQLGVYMDQLIRNMDNAIHTVAIEKENTLFVSAPDALNENDNKELTENALILSYINGVKDKAKPNAEGQEYIRSRVINAIRRKGDVNGDGQVNYNDALLVLRASINLATLSEDDKRFAEVDGKNGISYNDALKILRASIGLDSLE
jgi:lysophospholipase L1-like esterase